jgi:hypothetical protein
MKYALSLGLLLGAVAVASAQQPAAPPRSPQAAPPPSPPPAVKVGDAMPDFTLPYLELNADGRPQPKQVKLSDFKGKQPVVLAFFPAAFSPG